jgi:hypothetical protein
MTSHEFTRAYLEKELDNPDDPDGVAHVENFMTRETVPCLITYRDELVRRYRQLAASGRTPAILILEIKPSYQAIMRDRVWG